MIAWMTGVVQERMEKQCVLRVGDIGYAIELVGVHPKQGEQVSWYIYDHIREDRRDLYGFASKADKDVFLRLIDVSGVGTKLAQNILHTHDSQTLTAKIISGDVDFLTSISGVGKKTAQKIILELKGALVEMEDVTTHQSVVEALESLGYRQADVRAILPHLTSEDEEAKIREALRLLDAK